jgi:uncharacterized protein
MAGASVFGDGDRVGALAHTTGVEAAVPAILDRAWQLRYVAEFTQGLAECSTTCGFFDFCRGASAGNRYFENSDFSSTQTSHCRNTRQELIQALITITRKEQA